VARPSPGTWPAIPELGQVFDDGRRVGAGCLSRRQVRDFVKRWARAAVDLGADRIFWDEPHWAHPGQFGLDRGAVRLRVRRLSGRVP
jgi:hypothetical protein